MSPDTRLVLLTLAAIGLLVWLVTRWRLNAFLALALAALLVGAGSPLGLGETVRAFQAGLGATLGGTAAIIALGAMLGSLLAASGGAGVLADRFIRWWGPHRAEWCLITLALVVGLATWFTVGLLLLLPILVSLGHRSGRPFLILALPLLAFLSVMHGLMPPHPGPMVAIHALGADTGRVILWGFAVGIPAALVAGPWLARRLAGRITLALPAAPGGGPDTPGPPLRPPAFAPTLLVMILPVGLLLLATATELVPGPPGTARSLMAWLGHPTVALLVAVLVAWRLLGRATGQSPADLLRLTERSAMGVGMVLLVVGGGGGFARVLRDGGAADAIGRLAAAVHLPPLLYAWLLAVFIRVATGSATVAITTAAGLMAPVLAAHPDLNRELLVIALGSGSLCLSHLNDGGFWIVKDCLGLTVGQTLRTWTVAETLLSGTGLVLVLVADYLV